ncbi:MAG: hypothetical protein H6Q73_3370 [Firmicutes bacterium]|nr:hypothetical protein [Bacillota bacterium]
MITITILKNPFNHSEKEIHTCVHVPGKTAYEYIQPYIMGMEDYVVSVDGNIADDTAAQAVNDDDWLAVCPVVGKSGSAWFRTIGMLALSYAVGHIAGTHTWGNLFKSKFWSSMAAGALTSVGGMLINHWFPAAKTDRQTYEISPTYNWSNANSPTDQGNALAVTYGTMRTAGQVLAQHVSSDDEDQYLNILMCGGQGPIDSISDIRINDNPISYYNDVTVETRLGTNDQEAISNFNDTYSDQSLAYELDTDGDWATEQTEGDAVEGLEVTLQFPYGLYYANDSGGLDNASVTVQVQYRVAGVDTWTDFTTATITAAKNTTFYRTYRIDNLTADQYEVRARCTSKSGTNSRYSTRVYWSQLSSIMYDDFSRPGKVLIGIKALATSQLSGSVPSITWLQTRDTVWVWNADSSAYEEKSASNPAWAAYDMIHRCRQLMNINTGSYEYFVQGASVAHMVYDDFASWAEFCDDYDLTFNYIYNTANDLWTSLQKPENVGRGKVIMRGTKFGCVCDAPGDPVQLFTVGNMITDKFKETFVSQKDRANAVEITFFNKDKAYEKEIVTAYADDYDSATEPNITQITMDGITSLDQAYREGKYRLRLNEYLVRTVEFNADVDAIACQINDVILLAHDVPQWGYSGRLLSATSTTLQLDREVTLEPDTSYAVAIQITNTEATTIDEVQSIVTVNVQGVTAETTTDTLTLTSDLSIVPIKWDLYSFGETSKVVKPFRVLNISRDQDMRRTISCIEYIEEVYTEATDIPEVSYSELDTTVDVSTVSVAEETYRQKDGTMISDINAAWTIPRTTTTAISGYKVLYSTDNGTTWTTACSGITSLSTSIIGVKTETTYLVKVCTINDLGIVSDGVEASIYITGKDLPPSDVASVSATIDATDSTKVNLSWSSVDDIDLAGYRIREGTTIVESLAQITTYTYAATESRAHTFAVTAVDNSGNESETAATVTIEVTVEPADVEDFAVSQRSSDRSYVDMSWTAVADTSLSHYEIRIGTDDDWDSATVIASQLKATSFSYQLTAEGYTYFFIKAVNAGGYYSTSPGEAAFQVVLAPDAVTNLAATQSTKDKSIILVTWDAVSGDDIAGYKVTVGDSSYITKELTYSYEASENTTYTFAVQSITTAGYYSKATSLSIAVTISAADVTGFAVSQSSTDRTKVILTWDAPTELDVSYYIIKLGTAWETAAVIGSRATGTSFETTITTESEQTFLIKAVTSAGNESQYPAEVSGIFDLNPDPVTDIVLSQSSADKSELDISWTGILESDLAYYDVRVGSSWEDATQITTTQETSCTYTLSASGSVKVLIRSMNEAEFYSDETTATLYCTVEPEDVSNFRVYQNGEYVELYWDKATEADVVSYEIREGSSFSTGSLVVTGQTTTNYKYIVDTERTYWYHIKAINKSGFYSASATSGSVTVTDLPSRNIIESYDELTLQSGTHTNTEFGTSQYKFSNLGGKFSDYTTTKFSEIGGATVLKLAMNDSEYYSSGTYNCEQIDIGQLITANITAYFVSTVLLASGTSATLEYRTSQDGETFTDWQDFTAVQSTFRYLEFRAVLATTDTTKTPEVNHFTISVDVPDTNLSLTATIDAGGTTVEYGETFYAIPVVIPTAIGENLYAQVIEKTTSGVTLKVKDSDNNDVGGTVDLLVKGY